MNVYVVRRHDGKYFAGCGYGGPGNPVPYWTERIWEAKVYKTTEGCLKAAKKLGAYAGMAETRDDLDAFPTRWIGFLVPDRGGRWRTVDEDPRFFDFNDYDGNNRPLE